MEKTGQMPWLKDEGTDDDAARSREDLNYMKRLFMPMSMEILAYVTEACDMLEYEGSFMFDECPDKQALYETAAKVKAKASYLENMYRPVLEEDEQLKAGGHCVSCRGMESWLDNLIWVILCGEIYSRRRRYFRIKERKMRGGGF